VRVIDYVAPPKVDHNAVGGATFYRRRAMQPLSATKPCRPFKKRNPTVTFTNLTCDPDDDDLYTKEIVQC